MQALADVKFFNGSSSCPTDFSPSFVGLGICDLGDGFLQLLISGLELLSHDFEAQSYSPTDIDSFSPFHGFASN